MTNDAQGGAELNAGAENSPADGGVGGGAMNAMPMAVEAVTGEKSRTSDQAALDLLCCPFCGAKPKTNNGGHSTFGRLWWCVWCDECQFEMRDQEVWLKDGSGRLDPAYPPRHCFSAWNLRAALAAPSAPAEVIDARAVAEAMDGDAGRWKACCGCYETCDGHPVGNYPYSAVLKCDLGGGCRECGGLGAIWDTTDYADMGDCLARGLDASAPAEVEGLADELAEMIDQAHADLDAEFADAEHTGERPDLQDSETMVPVYLLERIAAALTAQQAEIERIKAEWAADLIARGKRYREAVRRAEKAESERDALEALHDRCGSCLQPLEECNCVKPTHAKLKGDV